ncbi:hypothetical protein FVB9288_02238 [Flavobacterium sp. CECT 9288]|uniref:RHS repeat domain-containing protein n=1 Tax=Flavobacterium sp. CECT 9288 TaxID=2845819 RepID=UPI001E36C174|nr:RHS repeat domain-containing protein [Flavobacterium sp. CECT 9288]CAH0336532.1 hypothetical protein FVB9288_02238 [Flavobacterium sp. CECT 9288]
MNRIFFSLIFLSCFVVSSFSQVTKDLPNYFPVSPNAASFAKQGLYPVDYSTGKLNVSIPIYTIKTKELTVPISLSYNTSGIQLNENASWVGLGWNLNAGGAIVRNTKGRPDGGNPIPDLRGNFAFNTENYRSLYDQQRGADDTAPDEYVVNAPGLSGSFYYDHTDSNKVLFRDFQNTKVEASQIESGGIKVTKDDGTVYLFGAKTDFETTSGSSAGDVIYQPDYTSAWYLSKIISANGREEILFNYKSIESHDYPVAGSESLFPLKQYSYIKTNFPPGLTSPRITKQFLESITFPNGRIEFLSTLDRQDLVEDYKLNSIEVSSVVNNQVKLLQKSSFNYDYYSRSGGSTTTDPIWSDPLINNLLIQNSKFKSLRLKEVVNNVLNTKHIFDYNTTQLPVRGTTKQDYWGYINGNNGSLTTPTIMDLLGEQGIISFGTGNRNADENLMKSGILEKITYPEGGFSIFEYEANQYVENVNTPTIVTKSVTTIGFGTGCGYYAGPNYQTQTFTTASSYVHGSGKLNINFTQANQESGANSRVTYRDEIFFRPNNNGSFFPSQSITVLRDFGGNSSHTISALENRSGNVGAAGCPSASITASWQEQTSSTIVPTTRFIGGLRIKSIKSYNGKNVLPVIIKQFDYQNENILNKIGSGSYKRYNSMDKLSLLSESLVPIYSSSAIYNNNIGSGPNITYCKVIETEIDPETSINNGKTEYYFENVASERVIDNVPIIYKHPSFNLFSTVVNVEALSFTAHVDDFAYFKSDTWNYGSLKKTNVYKRDALNSLKLIKSTENKYSILKLKILPYNVIFNTMVKNELRPGDYMHPEPYDQRNDYASGRFFYFSGGVSLGKKVMTGTIETDYDKNEKPTTTKTTNYFFENPAHNQITRTETKNSKDELLISKMYYPDDLSNEPFMSELIAQNRISAPVRTETYKNSAVLENKLSEQKTIFTKEASTGNLLLTKSVYSAKFPNVLPSIPNVGNLEKKLTYDQYDSNGNLLQYTPENGTPVSIIWGYNKTQPIAKIENATYAQVQQYEANLQALSNGIDENSLIAALNALRTNLPNAMISTYTHIPLVGVSTITDPKGLKTTYEYDAFNRLKWVKDQDGNVLQKYCYNYNGETVNCQ